MTITAISDGDNGDKGKEGNVTARELALFLHTDQKSVRRFLRRQFPHLSGRPGNWDIESTALPALKEAWDIVHSKPKVPDTNIVHKKPVMQIHLY